MVVVRRRGSIFAKTLAAVAVVAVLGVAAVILGAGGGGDDLAEYRLPDGSLDVPRLGRDLYVRNCRECHGRDGAGDGLAYPPLAGSPWLVRDPETPARILLGGLYGPILVNGRTYFGNMPSWRHWSDEELAAVLTHTRSSFGNDAPPVSAETVAEVRAEGLPGGSGWNARELAEVRDDE